MFNINERVISALKISFRIVSIVTIKRLPPASLLKLSLCISLSAAFVIALGADKNALLLYVCAGIFGFSFSWAYGALYLWTAEHMDVVVSVYV